MAKRPVHEALVEQKLTLSPHMVRVTFHSPSFRDLPPDSESGYMKLLLEGQTQRASVAPPQDTKTLDPKNFTRRSFTIRHLDRERGFLTMDFVHHPSLQESHLGPAGNWLATARSGDGVLLAGPGPVKSLDPDADWVFVVADMSALSAAVVNLERLPGDAVGVAVLEVLCAEDRQPIDAPAGIEIRWIVTPSTSGSELLEAVRSIPWREGRVSVWSACEFMSARSIRNYFRVERDVPMSDAYVSSYWKIDASDEEHKAAKKVDD